ncbi:MAG: hypothetical protein LBC88_04370 [Spirochaetaceae bacterium]|nr:hypothetical protein [Spirochaetaceae bacterium]
MRFDDKTTNNDASARGICRAVRAAALLVFLLLASYAGAQSTHEDLFIAPCAALLFSSDYGFAPGGGVTLGVGEGAALGLQVLYAVDAVSLNILEMAFFFRLYLPFARGSTGPFLQLLAGTVLFGLNGPPTLPAGAGSFSAAGAFGWRFPLGAHFYIEPMVRAGYPYLAGGSLSAGMRF